jgi:hypothetical protein
VVGALAAAVADEARRSGAAAMGDEAGFGDTEEFGLARGR